jgi:hypothetical protein
VVAGTPAPAGPQSAPTPVSGIESTVRTIVEDVMRGLLGLN